MRHRLPFGLWEWYTCPAIPRGDLGTHSRARWRRMSHGARGHTSTNITFTPHLPAEQLFEWFSPRAKTHLNVFGRRDHASERIPASVSVVVVECAIHLRPWIFIPDRRPLRRFLQTSHNRHGRKCNTGGSNAIVCRHSAAWNVRFGIAPCA